ncbi:acyl-CoA thioesterase [Kitasatospora mediocidica]|uniref:acyl-CoA thioesterase n=1 Tax=Kitasatospora mediocidica TaxID=58352 RepID=UPI000690CEDA|nr:thioesterase family protein [Kitasatospora mediocidica]
MNGGRLDTRPTAQPQTPSATVPPEAPDAPVTLAESDENAHVLCCPTRWSDVDENGHINNARLVGYIQEGIHDLFYHHARAVRDSLFPAGFLIARHEIDYLQQLHHQPEPLLVRLQVERLGRSSAQVRVDVCREPFTYMTARTVVVARDRTSGRSRKLSQSERRFLSDYLTDSPHLAQAQGPSKAQAKPVQPKKMASPKVPQARSRSRAAALPRSRRG